MTSMAEHTNVIAHAEHDDDRMHVSPAVAKRVVDAYTDLGIPTDGLPIPTFSPPATAPMPAWAVRASEWTSDVTQWTRMVRRDFDGLFITQIQDSSEPGESHYGDEPCINIDVDVLSGEPTDLAGQARRLAHSLLQAADALDGPPRAGQRGSAGGLQHRVIIELREAIKRSPLSQSQLAVAAGYGGDELSGFMTGRRRMDLTDVERLAGALGIDAADLMAEVAA